MKYIKKIFNYFFLVILKHSFFILRFIISSPKYILVSLKILFRYLSFMLLNNLFLKKKYLSNRVNFVSYMRENLKYSDDWFTNNIHAWCYIFEKKNFFNKDINILEIGSYEGISACFFLRFLKSFLD